MFSNMITPFSTAECRFTVTAHYYLSDVIMVVIEKTYQTMGTSPINFQYKLESC